MQSKEQARAGSSNEPPIAKLLERAVDEQSGGGSLPTDLVADWSRRLELTAIICLVIWAVYTVLGLTLWAHHSTIIGHVVAIGATVASCLLVVFIRVRTPSQRSLMVAGFSFEIVMGLAISLGEFSVFNASQTVSQVSWTCVLLLFFPLLVPASPRDTLIGSLLTFATSPVGYIVNIALGVPSADNAAILVSRFLPQLVCVGLAYVSARALHRLTSSVRQARRLGSYELVDQIGSGGMGEVWRARHRMLVRPAAIKLVRPSAGDSDRLRKRFEREAQATAALESPHTVQLYDFGVADDGSFYYVMELLHGVDIQRLVTRFGPQEPSRVVYLMRQICDSLDDAHRIGLIHRDIKPANIFLAIKGRRLDFIKVLDFGLVHSEQDRDTVGVTGENEIIGTPAYLAPEMSTGQGEIDGRVDVYGLGCVAYWLLTGTLVFEADNALAVAVAHVSSEPASPSERLGCPVPAELERIVLQCLAKNPAERPGARDLAGQLADLAATLDDGWTASRAHDWWAKCLPEILGRHANLAADEEQKNASLFPVRRW